MIIKIYDSDGKSDNFVSNNTISKFDDTIEEIISSCDSNIERATLSETFVTRNNDISDVKRYMNLYKTNSSLTILLEEGKKQFTINVSGKLADCVSYFITTNLYNVYDTLLSCKTIDYNLVKYFKDGTRFRENTNKSLILEYLSSKNGNTDYNVIWEYLKYEVDKPKVLEFVLITYQFVYDEKFEDSMIPSGNATNKLSLENLKMDGVDKLESYVSQRLGVRILTNLI